MGTTVSEERNILSVLKTDLAGSTMTLVPVYGTIKLCCGISWKEVLHIGFLLLRLPILSILFPMNHISDVTCRL
jgi:hypothetical protein